VQLRLLEQLPGQFSLRNMNKSDEWKVKNYTPHAITLYDDKGEHILAVLPSCGHARVREIPIGKEKHLTKILGVPVIGEEYGEIEGLPPRDDEPDTFYIVSLPCFYARGHQRTDLIAPDTGIEGVVRDQDGRIIGVKRFIRLYRD
jgi:hypothetical protein